MTREQLSSFLGVAEQSINILTEQNVRAQRALLKPPRDVLIEPDLGDLSTVDFEKGERFIALGEKATRAAAAELCPLRASARRLCRVSQRAPAAACCNRPRAHLRRRTRDRDHESGGAAGTGRSCAGSEARLAGRADRHRDALRPRRLCAHRLPIAGPPGKSRRRVRRRREILGSGLHDIRHGLLFGYAGRQHIRSADALQEDVAQSAGRRVDQRRRARHDERRALRVLPAAQPRANNVRDRLCFGRQLDRVPFRPGDQGRRIPRAR